jgi:hypothetical protein
MRSTRQTASKLELIRKSAGGPLIVAKKAIKLARTFAIMAHGGRARSRLNRLRDLGLIEVMPSRKQLRAGARRMFEELIVPAVADHYEKSGIDMRFQVLLRVLDDPSALVDPLGLASDVDVIIGHLMHVVHVNPAYDLQLLSSEPGGLESLERQVEQLIARTHPRTESILAILEDHSYPQRLLEYVRAFRRDPHAPPPVRDNVANDPRFAAAEKKYGTLTAAMRTFASLSV